MKHIRSKSTEIGFGYKAKLMLTEEHGGHYYFEIDLVDEKGDIIYFDKQQVDVADKLNYCK